MIQYLKNMIQKTTEDNFFSVLFVMLVCSMTILIVLVNFFNYFLSSPSSP